jgi:conjugal transfer pilus assembly protein TraB
MWFKKKDIPQSDETKREKKQKKFYYSLVFLVVIFVIFLGSALFENEQRKEPSSLKSKKISLPSQDPESSAENIRIAQLEITNDLMEDRLSSFEKNLRELKEENTLLEASNQKLAEKAQAFQTHILTLEKEKQVETTKNLQEFPEIKKPELRTWGDSKSQEERNVLFEIPAGTIVKCVLVSAADCSVAVKKPSGPNMLLLRPLANGKLPRNVRVPLKGSVIIGNGVGDIASERVYIRGERMTLVQRNGDFVETEISAFVSGEDGKEGMRGVVVDRSGSIITRAAFAAFFQGVGQGIQATLNNQTIEKLSKVGDSSVILDVDTYRNSGLQGANTALDKLADNFIEQSKQIQPCIQIQAGRVVDVIFTKAVKIGEKDLKKKLDHERSVRG